MNFTFIDTYPWLLPIIIFFGRICDVTLGTMRIIFVSKGEKYKAPFVGFLEVFIWIVIISQVLSRANNLTAYIAYAAGYAMGNFVGIMIEQRIAFGVVLFRIFTKKQGKELMTILSANGFGSTCIHAEGSVSEVDIVETVIQRKSTRQLEEMITEYDPKAFYYIEDIRKKEQGVFSKVPKIFQYRRPGK